MSQSSDDDDVNIPLRERLARKERAQEREEEAKEIDNSCPICLDQLQSEYANVNACKHRFHTQCIMNWSTVQNTCPLCNTRFASIVTHVIAAADTDVQCVKMKRVQNKDQAEGSFRGDAARDYVAQGTEYARQLREERRNARMEASKQTAPPPRRRKTRTTTTTSSITSTMSTVLSPSELPSSSPFFSSSYFSLSIGLDSSSSSPFSSTSSASFSSSSSYLTARQAAIRSAAGEKKREEFSFAVPAAVKRRVKPIVNPSEEEQERWAMEESLRLAQVSLHEDNDDGDNEGDEGDSEWEEQHTPCVVTTRPQKCGRQAGKENIAPTNKRAIREQPPAFRKKTHMRVLEEVPEVEPEVNSVVNSAVNFAVNSAVNSEVEPAVNSEVTPAVTPGVRPEVTPAVEPNEMKAEVTPAVDSEMKSEVESEVEAGVKSEVKSEVEAEVKAEEEPEELGIKWFRSKINGKWVRARVSSVPSQYLPSFGSSSSSSSSSTLLSQLTEKRKIEASSGSRVDGIASKETLVVTIPSTNSCTQSLSQSVTAPAPSPSLDAGAVPSLLRGKSLPPKQTLPMVSLPPLLRASTDKSKKSKAPLELRSGIMFAAMIGENKTKIKWQRPNPSPFEVQPPKLKKVLGDCTNIV